MATLVLKENKKAKRKSRSRSGQAISSQGQHIRPCLTKEEALIILFGEQEYKKRKTFLSLSDDLLLDDEFIQKVLEVRPDLYWCENMPSSIKANIYDLCLAIVDGKVNEEDWKLTPDKVQGRLEVIEECLISDYLFYVQRYWGHSGSQTYDVFLKDGSFHKKTLREFLVMEQGGIPVNIEPGNIVEGSNLADSLVKYRKEWVKLLTQRKDDCGLDIIFKDIARDYALEIVQDIIGKNEYFLEPPTALINLFDRILTAKDEKASTIMKRFLNRNKCMRINKRIGLDEQFGLRKI